MLVMVLKVLPYLILVSLMMKASLVWGFSHSRLEDYLQQAEKKNLSATLEWTRLGHYQKNILGQLRSPVRGDFFISPEGPSNPRAELQATITAFFSGGRQ